jgi:hypothetical protein
MVEADEPNWHQMLYFLEAKDGSKRKGNESTAHSNCTFILEKTLLWNQIGSKKMLPHCSHPLRF